jgi:hypothetical protein
MPEWKVPLLHGDALFRETPEIKHIAMKTDVAISEVDRANAGFPSAIGSRSPPQAQSVWRGIKNSLADWKLPMIQFERGRGRCFARAVVVRIRLEAVVEENVPIVFGIRDGGTGQDQQPNQTEKSNGNTDEV